MILFGLDGTGPRDQVQPSCPATDVLWLCDGADVLELVTIEERAPFS
jgi:hypothetical protein